MLALDAHAKINLRLQILARRPDGFHEIESLMAPIGLADRIELERATRPGIEFACDAPDLPADDDNLVVRAARAFHEALGTPPALSIRLSKRIPHGAGLGGGSSDAAATLLGLNALHDRPLPRATLHEIAARLGSDIPFFLLGTPAIARGRGEILVPHPIPQSIPVALFKPSFGVPTPEAYRRWRSARPLPGIDYAPQSAFGLELVNDLEVPVFEKYLFLAHLKTWLRARPETVAALMSGSGSTLFALCHDDPACAALARHARDEFGDDLWTHTDRVGIDQDPRVREWRCSSWSGEGRV